MSRLNYPISVLVAFLVVGASLMWARASAEDDDDDTIPICHDGQTIYVDLDDLFDHLGHLDILGECPESPVQRSPR